eukprot:9297111-Pyramimonas_sp.AAC.1
MLPDCGLDRLQSDTAKLLDVDAAKRQEGAHAAQKAVAQFFLTLPHWMHGFGKPETLQTIGRRFYGFA